MLHKIVGVGNGLVQSAGVACMVRYCGFSGDSVGLGWFGCCTAVVRLTAAPTTTLLTSHCGWLGVSSKRADVLQLKFRIEKKY